MERYNQIKALIAFNLDTTLEGLEITRTGTDLAGAPLWIEIKGAYSFGKSYAFKYDYSFLTALHEQENLTRFLLELRAKITDENT